MQSSQAATPAPRRGTRAASQARPSARSRQATNLRPGNQKQLTALKHPQKVAFRCPLCGSAGANYAPRGDGQGWFVSCWACDVSGGEWLRLVAAEVGASGGGDLLANPAIHLAPYVIGSAGADSGRRAKLPSAGRVAGWASRLHSEAEPLEWLTEARGISFDVIEAARIGWDGDRLIFPMLWHGKVVAAKHRLPLDGAQMMAWPGRDRAWPLYPQPRCSGWVLLVAGELDALRARSAGLPAVSVTLGAGHWREEWTAALRGRRVVVCFDNNERAIARRRVRELRRGGVRATRLDLRKLGLDEPKGDLSDYLNNGGSIRGLRRAV